MRTSTGAWFGALALAAVLGSACGSAPAPVTGNVSSPSASQSVASVSPKPTPSPAFNPCPPPSNRCLALVTLRGSDAYVVRDITDITHPKTVSSLGAIYGPVFVTATELSYANDTGVFRTPLSGSPKALVVKSGGIGDWSPDGNALVY